MQMFIRVSLLLLVSAAPLVAQRGAPPRRDSAPVRQTPDGFVLDFVDQDVSIVLRAIAEAGGLSVTMSNLPAARVSLRMAQQMSRDAAVDALRAVAEGSEITMTEGSSVIRLVGPPRAATPARMSPQQLAMQNQQARILNLYTVRLKHSTATTVAPMLMNLLAGSGSVGSTTRTTSPIGNIQNMQQGGGPGGGLAGRFGGGGGGGGGGGALGGAVIGGGGGGGGGGGVTGGISEFVVGGPGGGQNPQVAIRNALGQALGLQVGTSSSGNAFSDIRIVADELTNSLIVRATSEDFQAMQQLVQSVDVRPLQVLIEVTIAQVERSDDLNLGLSGSATRRTGANAGDTAAVLPGASSARDFVYMLAGGKGSVNYDIALNALQSRGNVRVLALPIIIAQNNREAVLNVGSNVPFVQVTQAGGFDPNARVQTIQYLPVGKQLTITPTINTDGYVNMEVTQTNDDVTNNLLFDAPIINQRQAQTTVFVRDGQTTVIGGLSDKTTDESTAGVPFLSRIPLLGWLFGNTRRNTRTTELFLFLTPHIVSSDEDIDRLRESIRGSSELLQNVRIEGRVNMGGDTINVGVPDSLRGRTPPLNLFLNERH